jgi:(p)ppGpp synthase/HD superfamily hydrolase
VREPARLVLAAAAFAAEAHRLQIRKGRDRLPYINHPLNVAELVAEGTADPEVLAAAILHDVLEDTDATAEDLATRFGPRVLGLVEELTDDPAWSGLPLGERKAKQAGKFAAKASAEARAIKIADQLSNIDDLVREPEVWPRERHAAYLAGARAIVAACRPAAPALAAQFDALAARYEAVIVSLQGG